jgi:hypothetical protein
MMYDDNSELSKAYYSGHDDGYQSGYDDGYESAIDSGYDDELGYRVEEEVKEQLKDEKMLWQGYIKRTHYCGGEIVTVWIEGPDYVNRQCV